MKNLKHQNCIIETIFMKKMRMDPGHRWWSRILFLLSEKETVWNRTRITPTQYHCTSTSSSSIVTVDAVTLLSQYFKCLSSNLISSQPTIYNSIHRHITLKPTLISLPHTPINIILSLPLQFSIQFQNSSNSIINFIFFSFLNGTTYWIHSRTRFRSI
jgi:hypothetical protein